MQHWDVLSLLSLTQLTYAALNCENECVPKCLDGWEEEGGKCYFFSQDVLTWVEAEEECKIHGSHLASVTSQKADDFLARNCKKGKSFWIGARQTFDSDNRGSWSWADGCSPWKHTSWGANFKPDNKSKYECALFSKNMANIATWRAGRCNYQRLRFICSKAICNQFQVSDMLLHQKINAGRKEDTGAGELEAKEDIGAGELDASSIGLFIFIGLASIPVTMTIGGLLFMCKTNCELQCCCTCKNLEKRDVNLIYGQYYYPDGRRMATEMEVKDRNPYYATLNMDGNMDTRVVDNNPGYGKH